jgi:hypothetical protein
MREGLREIGRSMAGFGKWLLVVILAHGLVLAGFFALGLGGLWAMGVGRRFDRWVYEHHISPALIVGVTAFVTVLAYHGWQEEREAEAEKRRQAARDLPSPGPVGSDREA